MTVYSTIYVSGALVSDNYNCTVKKSVSDNNTSSSFTAYIENFAGRNKNKFNVGNDVEVYADVGSNPPSTKIFKGIVETVNFEGEGLDEKIRLEGRDYSAELVDRTVEPETYTNWEIGSIVRDIVSKYTTDITTTNVQTVGGSLARIAFRHTPVYDAIKQLADFAEYSFYVDTNKDLHFEPTGSGTSGYVFNAGSNLIRSDFTTDRESMYNQVWVYGDRYLDGYKETFKAGSYSAAFSGSPYSYTSGGSTCLTIANGSTYPLIYNPHNTEVTVNGSIVQPGNIQNLNFTAPAGTKYLVGYDDRIIVFTSGTDYGNNIPASGASIAVNYKRSLPIVKVGDNEPSKTSFKQRNKIIIDKDIKDPATAQNILEEQLAQLGNPRVEGNLEVRGVVNVTPGNSCTVNLPNQGIVNQDYTIIEAKYEFNKENNLKEQVLSLKLNARIGDVSDTIKKIILDQRKIQAGDISDTDIITRYQTAIGSLSLRQSGLSVYTRSIAGNTLIWGNAGFGIFGSYNWGDVSTYSFVLRNPNAGILGTSKLGNNLSTFKLLWSGGYF